MMLWLIGWTALLEAATGQSPCVDRVNNLTAAAVAGHPAADARLFRLLALSSGQSLSRDAGKYSLCVGQEGARYFLVNFQAQGGNISFPPFGLGLCLLSNPPCSHEDAAHILTSPMGLFFMPALGGISIEPGSVIVKSPQLDLKGMQWGSGISSVFLSIMLILALCATLARGCVPRPSPSQPGGTGVSVQQQATQQSRTAGSSGGEPLIEGRAPAPSEAPRASRRLPQTIQAFSLTGPSGTLTKLLELNAYKPTDSLNGVRVLSMFWIILGHTFLMPEGISGYFNPQDIKHSNFQHDTADTNTLFFFVISAQAGVDSFFFLSGFLLSLLTLRELQAARSKYNVGLALLLRYFRLTPSLAFVMLVYYKILPHLAEGPFAPQLQESIAQRCDASWWSELTYTLNFIPFDSNKVCMGWTWYLGDDMIFYIISILLLPLYHRSRAIGCGVITILTVASVAITIWLVFAHHLSIDALDYHYIDYSYWAYSKPYTRVPAFFVGVVAAWLLLELERRGYTRGQQATTVRAKALAFIVSLACLGIMLFLILIPATDHGLHANDWSDVTSATYITFARPLWSVCLAVITLLCYYDYMPMLNGFLSHPGWTPLARLTYGAYLVHPLVIKLSAANATQYYMFSGMDLFYRWIGNCFCAFSGATVVWCLVERPIMTLTTSALKGRPVRSALDKQTPTSSQPAAQSSGGVTTDRTIQREG